MHGTRGTTGSEACLLVYSVVGKSLIFPIRPFALLAGKPGETGNNPAPSDGGQSCAQHRIDGGQSCAQHRIDGGQSCAQRRIDGGQSCAQHRIDGGQSCAQHRIDGGQSCAQHEGKAKGRSGRHTVSLKSKAAIAQWLRRRLRSQVAQVRFQPGPM